MKINQHNYESFLIDYIDGNLSDVERMDVELFLQENPDIAEQISDFADVVLLPNNEINYDKKEELLIVALPNQEFEQWEATQPKLSKQPISYPHKQKLLKLGKRGMPQWVRYAAAACVAFVITFTIYNLRFTNENVLDELPIVVLPVEEIENKIENENEVASTSSATLLPIVATLPPVVEPVETTTPHPAPDTGRGVLHTPNTLIAHDASGVGVCNTPLRGTLSSSLVAISTIPLTTENLTLSPQTDLLIEPRFEEELELEAEEFRLIERVVNNERLLAAADQFIVTPAKIVIHNIFRRYYERRTDVEMFFEEREIPRFFAQR